MFHLILLSVVFLIITIVLLLVWAHLILCSSYEDETHQFVNSHVSQIRRLSNEINHETSPMCHNPVDRDVPKLRYGKHTDSAEKKWRYKRNPSLNKRKESTIVNKCPNKKTQKSNSIKNFFAKKKKSYIEYIDVEEDDVACIDRLDGMSRRRNIESDCKLNYKVSFDDSPTIVRKKDADCYKYYRKNKSEVPSETSHPVHRTKYTNTPHKSNCNYPTPCEVLHKTSNIDICQYYDKLCNQSTCKVKNGPEVPTFKQTMRSLSIPVRNSTGRNSCCSIDSITLHKSRSHTKPSHRQRSGQDFYDKLINKKSILKTSFDKNENTKNVDSLNKSSSIKNVSKKGRIRTKRSNNLHKNSSSSYTFIKNSKQTRPYRTDNSKSKINLKCDEMSEDLTQNNNIQTLNLMNVDVIREINKIKTINKKLSNELIQNNNKDKNPEDHKSNSTIAVFESCLSFQKQLLNYTDKIHNVTNTKTSFIENLHKKSIRDKKDYTNDCKMMKEEIKSKNKNIENIESFKTEKSIKIQKLSRYAKQEIQNDVSKNLQQIDKSDEEKKIIRETPKVNLKLNNILNESGDKQRKQLDSLTNTTNIDFASSTTIMVENGKNSLYDTKYTLKNTANLMEQLYEDSKMMLAKCNTMDNIKKDVNDLVQKERNSDEKVIDISISNFQSYSVIKKQSCNTYIENLSTTLEKRRNTLMKELTKEIQTFQESSLLAKERSKSYSPDKTSRSYSTTNKISSEIIKFSSSEDIHNVSLKRQNLINKIRYPSVKKFIKTKPIEYQIRYPIEESNDRDHNYKTKTSVNKIKSLNSKVISKESSDVVYHNCHDDLEKTLNDSTANCMNFYEKPFDYNDSKAHRSRSPKRKDSITLMSKSKYKQEPMTSLKYYMKIVDSLERLKQEKDKKVSLDTKPESSLYKFRNRSLSPEIKTHSSNGNEDTFDCKHLEKSGSPSSDTKHTEKFSTEPNKYRESLQKYRYRSRSPKLKQNTPINVYSRKLLDEPHEYNLKENNNNVLSDWNIECLDKSQCFDANSKRDTNNRYVSRNRSLSPKQKYIKEKIPNNNYSRDNSAIKNYQRHYSPKINYSKENCSKENDANQRFPKQSSATEKYEDIEESFKYSSNLRNYKLYLPDDLRLKNKCNISDESRNRTLKSKKFTSVESYENSNDKSDQYSFNQVEVSNNYFKKRNSLDHPCLRSSNPKPNSSKEVCLNSKKANDEPHYSTNSIQNNAIIENKNILDEYQNFSLKNKQNSFKETCSNSRKFCYKPDQYDSIPKENHSIVENKNSRPNSPTPKQITLKENIRNSTENDNLKTNQGNSLDDTQSLFQHLEQNYLKEDSKISDQSTLTSNIKRSQPRSLSPKQISSKHKYKNIDEFEHCNYNTKQNSSPNRNYTNDTRCNIPYTKQHTGTDDYQNSKKIFNESEHYSSNLKRHSSKSRKKSSDGTKPDRSKPKQNSLKENYQKSKNLIHDSNLFFHSKKDDSSNSNINPLKHSQSRNQNSKQGNKKGDYKNFGKNIDEFQKCSSNNGKRDCSLNNDSADCPRSHSPNTKQIILKEDYENSRKLFDKSNPENAKRNESLHSNKMNSLDKTKLHSSPSKQNYVKDDYNKTRKLLNKSQNFDYDSKRNSSLDTNSYEDSQFCDPKTKQNIIKENYQNSKRKFNEPESILNSSEIKSHSSSLKQNYLKEISKNRNSSKVLDDSQHCCSNTKRDGSLNTNINSNQNYSKEVRQNFRVKISDYQHPSCQNQDVSMNRNSIDDPLYSNPKQITLKNNCDNSRKLLDESKSKENLLNKSSKQNSIKENIHSYKHKFYDYQFRSNSKQNETLNESHIRNSINSIKSRPLSPNYKSKSPKKLSEISQKLFDETKDLNTIQDDFLNNFPHKNSLNESRPCNNNPNTSSEINEKQKKIFDKPKNNLSTNENDLSRNTNKNEFQSTDLINETKHQYLNPNQNHSLEINQYKNKNYLEKPSNVDTKSNSTDKMLINLKDSSGRTYNISVKKRIDSSNYLETSLNESKLRSQNPKYVKETHQNLSDSHKSQDNNSNQLYDINKHSLDQSNFEECKTLTDETPSSIAKQCNNKNKGENNENDKIVDNFRSGSPMRLSKKSEQNPISKQDYSRNDSNFKNTKNFGDNFRAGIPNSNDNYSNGCDQNNKRTSLDESRFSRSQNYKNFDPKENDLSKHLYKNNIKDSFKKNYECNSNSNQKDQNRIRNSLEDRSHNTNIKNMSAGETYQDSEISHENNNLSKNVCINRNKNSLDNYRISNRNSKEILSKNSYQNSRDEPPNINVKSNDDSSKDLHRARIRNCLDKSKALRQHAKTHTSNESKTVSRNPYEDTNSKSNVGDISNDFYHNELKNSKDSRPRYSDINSNVDSPKDLYPTKSKDFSQNIKNSFEDSYLKTNKNRKDLYQTKLQTFLDDSKQSIQNLTRKSRNSSPKRVSFDNSIAINSDSKENMSNQRNSTNKKTTLDGLIYTTVPKGDDFPETHLDDFKTEKSSTALRVNKKKSLEKLNSKQIPPHLNSQYRNYYNYEDSKAKIT